MMTIVFLAATGLGSPTMLAGEAPMVAAVDYRLRPDSADVPPGRIAGAPATGSESLAFGMAAAAAGTRRRTMLALGAMPLFIDAVHGRGRRSSLRGSDSRDRPWLGTIGIVPWSTATREFTVVLDAIKSAAASPADQLRQHAPGSLALHMALRGAATSFDTGIFKVIAGQAAGPALIAVEQGRPPPGTGVRGTFTWAPGGFERTRWRVQVDLRNTRLDPGPVGLDPGSDLLGRLAISRSF